ncbi:MAG: hypothetical protein R3C60_00815 [Parvularculaceae bacterium]
MTSFGETQHPDEAVRLFDQVLKKTGDRPHSSAHIGASVTVSSMRLAVSGASVELLAKPATEPPFI